MIVVILGRRKRQVNVFELFFNWSLQDVTKDIVSPKYMSQIVV